MIRNGMVKLMIAFAASITLFGAIWAADAVASRPNAEVKVLSPITLAPDGYMAWPNGEENIERPLQIVMNFKAKDTADEAVASGYGKYKCDFYLTFSGLTKGMITADDCYLAGNYGTFGWIVIPADGLELWEGEEYPVVSAYDANLTYNDICSSVKDFTAAIHVAPAILEANPDFKVQLALKMTNPDDENDVYTVGTPAVYDFASLTAKREVKVLMPAVSDIKVGGAASTYAQEEIVRDILNDITQNSTSINIDTGIFAADNADEVAVAKKELENQGVDVSVAKAELSVKLFDVALDGTDTIKFTYDVVPCVSVGDKSVKIAEFSSDVKFRLPLPSSETRTVANVYHNAELLGRYDIKSLNGEKFVEVASKNFSAFAVEPLYAVAKIGDKEYFSLESAVAAAVANDTVKLERNISLAETLVIPADKEDLTIDLNGKTVSGGEGVKLSNLGELTVKDSSGALNSLCAVLFENNGSAWLNGGLFMAGVVNGESAKIQIAGGGYPTDVNRAWMPEGYACGKVSKNGLSGYIVAKLPTATVGPIPPSELPTAIPLTFSLKFKANGVSEEQMTCFEKWYADFEFTVVDKDVTFNVNEPSDGYLAGSYKNWLDGSWVSVPTTDVKLTANTPLRIMAYGEELLSTNGLKMTYREIATVVKDFNCGVLLRPQFMEANPGLTVKLSLKMYNPDNEAESYTIGGEYVFTVPSETHTATIMDVSGMIVNCESVEDAVQFVLEKADAVNGGKIVLLKDEEISSNLTIAGTRNLFFDLGAKKLSLAEGKKFALSGVNVAFVGEGTLEGFTAGNIELDDRSVLTLPASASALAGALEDAGKYVTKNADDTWSVANKFELQIQVVDGVPTLGFLQDERRTYTVEASSDISTWSAVTTAGDAETQSADMAVPLQWHKPESGRFFRVKAQMDD